MADAGNMHCTFYFDLCKAFVSENIPLYKLENEALKGLLRKYINHSNLTKYYVEKYYNVVMEKNKRRLGKRKYR